MSAHCACNTTSVLSPKIKDHSPASTSILSLPLLPRRESDCWPRDQISIFYSSTGYSDFTIELAESCVNRNSEIKNQRLTGLSASSVLWRQRGRSFLCRRRGARSERSNIRIRRDQRSSSPETLLGCSLSALQLLLGRSGSASSLFRSA